MIIGYSSNRKGIQSLSKLAPPLTSLLVPLTWFFQETSVSTVPAPLGPSPQQTTKPGRVALQCLLHPWPLSHSSGHCPHLALDTSRVDNLISTDVFASLMPSYYSFCTKLTSEIYSSSVVLFTFSSLMKTVYCYWSFFFFIKWMKALCHGLTCVSPPPPNSYVDVLALGPQNVTIFGDRAFREMIKLTWGHYPAWLNLDTERHLTCVYTDKRPREDTARRHRQASGETNPADTLILDFLSPATGEDKFVI